MADLSRADDSVSCFNWSFVDSDAAEALADSLQHPLTATDDEGAAGPKISSPEDSNILTASFGEAMGAELAANSDQEDVKRRVRRRRWIGAAVVALVAVVAQPVWRTASADLSILAADLATTAANYRVSRAAAEHGGGPDFDGARDGGGDSEAGRQSTTRLAVLASGGGDSSSSDSSVSMRTSGASASASESAGPDLVDVEEKLEDEHERKSDGGRGREGEGDRDKQMVPLDNRFVEVDQDTVRWLQTINDAENPAPTEVYKIAERHFNETVGQPINIAVLGQSGVGKSTLVNTLRGLGPSSPGAARVSSTQMTGVRSEFVEEGHRSPFNPTVVYYDLPGCGTAAVPRAEYIETYKLRERYDAFILVLERRVDESDLWLYDFLTRNRKRVFLVRNKVNIDILSEAEDYAREPAETLGLIRDDMAGEFKLADSGEIYLISAKLRDSGRFDLPRLKTDIGASLGSVKQRKFALSLAEHTELLLAQRQAAATDAVRSHALMAAANSGLNPVPIVDSAINFGVVMSMNHEVAKAFGVTEKQVELQAMALDDHLLLEGAAGTVVVEASAVASEFGAKFLAQEAVRSFICTGSSLCGTEAAKLIPVVGNIISGSVTFVLVRWLGMHVVEDARRAAEKINAILLQGRHDVTESSVDGSAGVLDLGAASSLKTTPRQLGWGIGG